MKQIQILLTLSIFFSISAIACHKHNHDDDDTVSPVVVVTSPAANDAIVGTVAIAGTVTDESLHEMSITITKDSDNFELFSANPTVHDLTSYAFVETWTPAGIAAETAVTLTVEAEDHSSNKTITTVKFTVKP